MLVFITSFSTNSQGQNIKPYKIYSLPLNVDESSGLIFINENLLVTHNDSRNPADLYFLESNGKSYSQHFPELVNHDWEEACYRFPDLYVGDFGNNCNCRQDLSVLHFVQYTDSTGKILFEFKNKISFNYSDQTNFPPGKSNFNFDCEAMILQNNSLVLFSKNKSIQGTGFTKIYSLDLNQTSTTAHLLDSIFTKEAITAAAVSNSGDTILLMGYFSLINLKVMDSVDYKFDFINQFFWKTLTQKEAICIGTNNQIFMTDERHGVGGNLYTLSWQTLQQHMMSNQVATTIKTPMISKFLKLQALVYLHLSTLHFTH